MVENTVGKEEIACYVSKDFYRRHLKTRACLGMGLKVFILRVLESQDCVVNPYSMFTRLTYQQQTAFENIVGKGEIAHNEQFLLFPQCFLLNQIIVSPFVNIL